jgi:hypothetical protein
MGTTLILLIAIVLFAITGPGAHSQAMGGSTEKALEAVTQELEKLDPTTANAADLVSRGRQVFRFDTFGDEAFWGDKLQLHLAIEGSRLGGVGPGLSPKGALAAGLKIDIDALPADLRQQLLQGKANLDDPAVTLALLQVNAVIGVTGHFNSSGTLHSVGLQCAFCTRLSTTPAPRFAPAPSTRTPARVVLDTGSTAGPIAI